MLRSLCVLLLLCGSLSAEEIRYPEKTSGKGELRYIGEIPVAVLSGSPEEIGEQYAELVLAPSKRFLNNVNNYLKKIGMPDALAKVKQASGLLFFTFPEDQKTEITTAVKKSGVDRDFFILANIMADSNKVGGCSTMIAEGKRSATGKPIFGRNLDWPPYELLPEHTLVIVFRPTGKRATAMVTFPLAMGCISGMNDAGLCLTINQITESKDQAKFNPLGTPMMLLYRQMLEKCSTVAEAEEFLTKANRTTFSSLTVCDKDSGAVFEVTPKNLLVRKGEAGVCCNTNHFRTDELSLTKKCSRYDILEKTQKSEAVLGVDEIAKELHKVNQSDFTIHTMVFEPSEKRLHLAFGKKSSAKKLTKLDLGPILEKGFGK